MLLSPHTPYELCGLHQQHTLSGAALEEAPSGLLTCLSAEHAAQDELN